MVKFPAKAHLFLAFILACVFSILVPNLIIQSKLRTNKATVEKTYEKIYCVMVTGKSDKRKAFARISIENFKMQRYPNKVLVIVNEGDPLNVADENVIEVLVPNRDKITLGDMRNIAFEYIPNNAIWTTWDDDDWRSEDYLSYLKSNLGDVDYVFFTRRIEHNLNNGFTFIMELRSGFVIMFGRKKPFTIYDSKDFNEDVLLKKIIIENLKYKTLQNDPKMYVRLSHDDNTSTLVKPEKSKVRDTSGNKVYFEYSADEEEIAYAKMIVKNFEKSLKMP